MVDVAVISFAQTPALRCETQRDDVELVLSAVNGAVDASGIPRDGLGFTVSGSNDLLIGRPFSFVTALDGIGAWPPIAESHVEMDGAWALYEAWVRLQHGDINAALVYAFGRTSAGDIIDVLALQLDPYTVAPLWPDSIAIAALQARALLDTGRYTPRDFAEVAVRSRRDATSNPNAQLSGDYDVETILAERPLVDPLRRHDCSPISDGAAAIVLATGDLAREVCERPAWITGIDHRIEPHALGLRDLTTSASTRLAGQKAGVGHGPIEVAELHAPFTPQELILRDDLGLDESTRINPSGGALSANAVMVAGLIRIGEAAGTIHRGEATRVLGHATSGPALQHNLVCLMEAS
jgi:acetyl-CoA acetyltransferase